MDTTFYSSSNISSPKEALTNEPLESEIKLSDKNDETIFPAEISTITSSNSINPEKLSQKVITETTMNGTNENIFTDQSSEVIFTDEETKNFINMTHIIPQEMSFTNIKSEEQISTGEKSIPSTPIFTQETPKENFYSDNITEKIFTDKEEEEILNTDKKIDDTKKISFIIKTEKFITNETEEIFTNEKYAQDYSHKTTFNDLNINDTYYNDEKTESEFIIGDKTSQETIINTYKRSSQNIIKDKSTEKITYDESIKEIMSDEKIKLISTDENVIVESSAPKEIKTKTTDVIFNERESENINLTDTIKNKENISENANITSTSISTTDKITPQGIIGLKTNLTKEEMARDLNQVLNEKEIGSDYKISGPNYTLIIKPTNSKAFKDDTTNIDFTKYEKIIREKFNIPNSEILTITQIEINSSDTQVLTNQVEYGIFNSNKNPIDLSACKDSDIVINHIRNKNALD